MKKVAGLRHNTKGYIVVEATILFPIMIMIFAALTLLAMYLPTRAALQNATQLTVAAIATEYSDSWLFYDEDSMSFYWESETKNLANVYQSLLEPISLEPAASKAETMVINADTNIVKISADKLTVEYSFVNFGIYKEIIITATRLITTPVNLSFIRFPTEIPVTVTSTAVVQNSDEFIRDADLAVDSYTQLSKKYGVTTEGLFTEIEEVNRRIPSFLKH